MNVYGLTNKELIHQEFGDGIKRTINPKGDRVNVVLSGKFLPYKTY